MTSRSQNPELYHVADRYRADYICILDHHGINYDSRARIHRNASSWALRKFGQQAGRLLLACDRVHSELVGRATGIWPAMLQSAIRDACALGIPNPRARKYRALADDLAAWLRGLESDARDMLAE